MEEDIEIIDSEHYKGEKEQKFSHQALVMKSIIKCIELGSKEMRTGYFNSKQDTMGNIARTYVEDTRKAFIESIRTAENIMHCDLDKKYYMIKDKINGKLDKKYKELVKKEEEWWNNLTIYEKQSHWDHGRSLLKGILHNKFPFAAIFLEEELISFRKILAQLTNITERKDGYVADMYEA